MHTTAACWLLCVRLHKHTSFSVVSALLCKRFCPPQADCVSQQIITILLVLFKALALVLQGFLAPGTDVKPIVPALENIWADSMGRSLSDFNFRTVTSKFNDLVFQYPIRIPERYSLVIRCVCTTHNFTSM